MMLPTEAPALMRDCAALPNAELVSLTNSVAAAAVLALMSSPTVTSNLVEGAFGHVRGTRGQPAGSSVGLFA